METQIKEFTDQVGDNKKKANEWMLGNVDECTITQVIPIFNTEKGNIMYVVIYMKH